jgi:large subunit ribosomal protein L2
MPVIKMKPTSPGTRFVVKLDKSHLHKGGPFEPLTKPQKSHSGRNNVGRITTRHQGSGHSHKYRLIDFRRDKDGIKGVVERIEHDPNRTSHIALIKYADGERRYILACKGMAPGDEVRSGSDSPI